MNIWDNPRSSTCPTPSFRNKRIKGKALSTHFGGFRYRSTHPTIYPCYARCAINFTLTPIHLTPIHYYLPYACSTRSVITGIPKQSLGTRSLGTRSLGTRNMIRQPFRVVVGFAVALPTLRLLDYAKGQ